jgi:hypothetical protein
VRLGVDVEFSWAVEEMAGVVVEADVMLEDEDVAEENIMIGGSTRNVVTKPILH